MPAEHDKHICKACREWAPEGERAKAMWGACARDDERHRPGSACDKWKADWHWERRARERRTP